jgi:transposase-like protein
MVKRFENLRRFMSKNQLPVKTWINVATLDELSEAQTLSSLLRSSGIETQLQDERRLQRFWFAVQPQGGIHVQVHTDASQKANEYLNTQLEAKVIFNKSIHCPSCNSSRVHYPAMTRKNLLPTLVAQILVMLGVQEHEFYCEDCHFTWQRKSKAAQKQAVKIRV